MTDLIMHMDASRIAELIASRALSPVEVMEARLSWLLRQLADTEAKDLYVRLLWPGGSKATQYPLATLQTDPEIAAAERPGMAVLSFEVLLVKDLGAKFSQRTKIVPELIQAASTFHANVGECLTPWQAKPPKITDGKLEPESVSTEALRDQVEREALQRAG
jgi:hypothetical protein